jgi:hypothetical protein
VHVVKTIGSIVTKINRPRVLVARILKNKNSSRFSFTKVISKKKNLNVNLTLKKIIPELLGYKTIVKNSTTLINVSFCLLCYDYFFQNVYLHVEHALNEIINSVPKLVHFTLPVTAFLTSNPRHFRLGINRETEHAKEGFSTVVSSTLPGTVILSCLKIELPTPEE